MTGDNYSATGSNMEAVKIWDIRRGECIQRLEGHGDLVSSVAISPDGKTLASGSYDSKIKLWDIRSGKCLKTLPEHDSRVFRVFAIAYSPDGQTLASISGDEPIKIWDLESGKCLKKISAKLYAGANIAGVTGLTPAQKASMKALGAVK